MLALAQAAFHVAAFSPMPAVIEAYDRASAGDAVSRSQLKAALQRTERFLDETAAKIAGFTEQAEVMGEQLRDPAELAQLDGIIALVEQKIDRDAVIYKRTKKKLMRLLKSGFAASPALGSEMKADFEALFILMERSLDMLSDFGLRLRALRFDFGGENEPSGPALESPADVQRFFARLSA
jgi:hypothetical protein